MYTSRSISALDKSPFDLRSSPRPNGRLPMLLWLHHRQHQPLQPTPENMRGKAGSCGRSCEAFRTRLLLTRHVLPATPVMLGSASFSRDTCFQQPLYKWDCRWFKLAALKRGGALWRPPDADATCLFCSTRGACQGMYPCRVVLIVSSNQNQF
jgi:hypothetical protein